MTRLLLICQGATSATRRAAFRDDEPLERRSAALAGSLAAALPRKNVALSGPSRCARETAEGLGLRATIDDGLRGLDAGRWRGASLDEIGRREPEALRGWLEKPTAAPHGGESLAALRRRVGAWLARQPADAGTIVAVTHPEFIQAAIAHVLAAPLVAFWRTSIEPLQVVELSRSGQDWTLREMVGPKSARERARRDVRYGRDP